MSIYIVLHRNCETVTMKNITVSVDEQTHRLARIRAAELDTSVSALVRDYLKNLVADHADGTEDNGPVVEPEAERRRRRLREVIEDIRAASPEFRAADNLPREELYDRARAEAQAAAPPERQDRKRE